MIERWLHLKQEFTDFWMGPVLSAFRSGADTGDLPHPPQELGELSLHISTRLGMIERVVLRLNRHLDQLLTHAQRVYTAQHVFTVNREAVALNVPQDCLYDLLVDLDALLFELNAVAELFKELLGLVHEHVGRPIPLKRLGGRLARLLRAEGASTQWFLLLDGHRNFFAHQGSPYVAIDITIDPWELLIVKRNVKGFDDPASFIRLREINEVLQGFSQSRVVLQRYLVSLLQAANPVPAAQYLESR